MKINALVENPDLRIMIGYPVGTCIKDAKELGRRMAKIIDHEFPHEKISLWCSGSSGSILSAIIANELHRVEEILYVKKNNEYTHGTGESYYVAPNSTHIIVDDFISTGNTIIRIYDHFTKSKEGQHIRPSLIVSRGVYKPCLQHEMEYDKIIAGNIGADIYQYLEKPSVVI